MKQPTVYTAGEMAAPSKLITQIKGQTIRTIIERLCELYKTKWPDEYQAFLDRMAYLRETGSRDMFTRHRKFRHRGEVPRKLCTLIGDALEDHDWLRNLQVSAIFWDVWSVGEFPATKKNTSWIMDGKAKAAIDGGNQSSDDHEGGTGAGASDQVGDSGS